MSGSGACIKIIRDRASTQSQSNLSLLDLSYHSLLKPLLQALARSHACPDHTMLEFPCVPWAVVSSIEEELLLLLDPLCRALCSIGALFSSCLLAKSWRRPPGYEDPTTLANETVFSVKEVEALYELFMRISNSVFEDGLIHKEEFQLALFRNSARKNLFADRVFYLFDRKQNGVIEFGEFVRSLSVFHPNARAEDKIQFAFKLYDLRQTGYIEREEVKEMLVALLRESASTMALTDDAIETILDMTFAEAQTKIEGRIDEEEWEKLVMKHPTLMQNMTLPYLKSIVSDFPSFSFVNDIDSN